MQLNTKKTCYFSLFPKKTALSLSPSFLTVFVVRQFHCSKGKKTWKQLTKLISEMTYLNRLFIYPTLTFIVFHLCVGVKNDFSFHFHFVTIVKRKKDAHDVAKEWEKMMMFSMSLWIMTMQFLNNKHAIQFIVGWLPTEFMPSFMKNVSACSCSFAHVNTISPKHNYTWIEKFQKIVIKM